MEKNGEWRKTKAKRKRNDAIGNETNRKRNETEQWGTKRNGKIGKETI